MENNPNVYKISLEDKEVILIGTAHVSGQSAKDVEKAFEEEQPDIIGIELDKRRYKAITSENKEDKMTIEHFFRYLFDGKLLEFLLIQILSIPQNKLAEKFNIKPGSEMLKGIDISQENDKKLIFLDRDISITIPRLIKSIPFWLYPVLGLSAIFSLFAIEFIKQEDIENLRSTEQLDDMMEQLSKTFPDLKKVMIDERDKIIAKNILEAEGEKILAIIGAGHIKGVSKYLKEGVDGIDFDKLNQIPDLNPFKNLF
jgi:pheromone shutdown-related protein TraB